MVISSKATTVYYNNSFTQVEFAITELQKSLKEKGESILIQNIDKAPKTIQSNHILVCLQSELNPEFAFNTSLIDEGFCIQITKEKGIVIVGKDAAGLMYGVLELAEQIKIKGLEGVYATTQNPYMKERGVKFNIPLDVRSPSYTDVSDAGQQNIANMWDFKFWTDYIDHVAKDRYNLISLWNLNPFPSMVKVPEYPEVALNDVQRSTTKWNEVYSMAAADYNAPEILNNVEVLKKITIDEKIEFWRKVMKYAKDRNVKFYIITWNILTYGAEGKHGIANDYKNETTIDYFRKSVKQMVLTYPDLAGIGISPSDNFSKEATSADKEEWVYRTFGLGLLDAVASQPDRKITFIHRNHNIEVDSMVSKFNLVIKNPNIHFVFSYKYSQGHSLSSTIQPFCNDFVSDLKKHPYLKTLWTLRNDDNYYFRWGSPDFVREFIKNIPYDLSEGFYYGSDGYIWGREFMSKDPKNAGELEIEKHWFHFMLWGRLVYNPDLSNETFSNMLATKFNTSQSKQLLEAWNSASMIYPVTTGFHWGAMDLQWYIEACKSLKGFAQNETGFHDVNRFINLPPHPGTRNQSIPSFVNMLAVNGKTDSITPVQVSKSLHEYSDKALALIKQISPNENIEFGYTVKDIQAMAYLGKYYAYKIAGAVELQKYRILNTKKKENQMAAVEQLTQAGIYWKMYIDLAKQSYKNPLWTNRVGYVDWDKLYRWVMDDLTIAKGGI